MEYAVSSAFQFIKRLVLVNLSCERIFQQLQISIPITAVKQMCIKRDNAAFKTVSRGFNTMSSIACYNRIIGNYEITQWNVRKQQKMWHKIVSGVIIQLFDFKNNKIYHFCFYLNER